MKKFYKVLVLGIGNIILSDDGFGIYAAQELNKKEVLPSNVLVLDIGTAAASYLYEISNCSNIIIIDALCAGNPPGTIYQMTDTDITYMPVKLAETHELSIISVIHQARMLTGLPTKVIIYGVEPYTLEIGYKLSPIVEMAVSKVIKLIEESIETLLSDSK